MEAAECDGWAGAIAACDLPGTLLVVGIAVHLYGTEAGGEDCGTLENLARILAWILSFEVAGNICGNLGDIQGRFPRNLEKALKNSKLGGTRGHLGQL